MSDCHNHNRQLCCCLLFNECVLAWCSVARLFLCVYLTSTPLASCHLCVFSFHFVPLEIWLDFRVARKGWSGKTRLVCSQLPAWFLLAVVTEIILFVARKITRLERIVYRHYPNNTTVPLLNNVCWIMFVTCSSILLPLLFFYFSNYYW